MEYCIKQEEATYILRYYLPCSPIYDASTTGRRQEELIRYCVQNQISAVMLYVDLNPYWYYMPDDLEHTEYYVDVINTFAKELRKHSISYQLNYQNLFGSWDGGADLRNVNGWENYVDEKGTESMGCACSAGKTFRETAGAKLRMWAATEPDVIWIDDDIRFHNHRTSIYDLWNGKISSERLDFGCFCEKHIEMFNQRYDSHHTRSEIVKGILSGDEHNEMRKRWLDFSGECAGEVAVWIEKTIHSVSPKTRVAVMTSLPDVHSVEGRDWDCFLKGLSGKGRPLIRPTFGPYSENSPKAFFSSYRLVEQLKANIKQQYKGEFDFCPEVENTRFTRWSKSLAATGYQILLSAFLGCKGVTLSIYDLEGCVLMEEPEFAGLLQEKRPLIDSLAKADLWEAESEGVGLMTAPDRIGAACNERRVSEMQQLASGRLWDDILLKAGIPCKYVTPDQINNCKCAALDGYTVNLLTDDELEQLLANGLILDAGAAAVLNRRGFTKYIGVTVGKKIECIAASEILHDFRHTDDSEVRVPSRINGMKWNELLPEGAETISTLITPYGTGYPGFTCFRNHIGGTVYVYAGNGSLGDGFFTNYRVKLLKNICENISGNSIFRLNNVSYAMLAVKRKEEETYVLAANMSADKMKDMILEAPYQVKEAVIIDREGCEHSVKVQDNKIDCTQLEMDIYEAFVCRVKFMEQA